MKYFPFGKVTFSINNLSKPIIQVKLKSIKMNNMLKTLWENDPNSKNCKIENKTLCELIYNYIILGKYTYSTNVFMQCLFQDWD